MSDMPPPPPPHIPPPPSAAPPPGTGMGGGYGFAQQPLQRVASIAKAITVLLWISLPLQAVGLATSFTVLDRARKFLDGTIDEDAFLDASVSTIGSAASILTLPIAILTFVWMYRMATNLRTLGRQGLSWSPRWAIGGWFTPPCVFVVPWLVFKELWRASDPEIAPYDTSWKQRPVSPLVNAWWVLYGLVPLLNIITGVQTIADLPQLIDENDTARTTAQNYVDTFSVSIVVGVASIAATVVYLMLVSRLTARHTACTGEQ